MDNDLFVNDLAEGRGTLKYCSYFVGGIRVKSKSDVYEAIKLKISNIIRKDNITNTISKFNYKTLSFGVGLSSRLYRRQEK